MNSKEQHNQRIFDEAVHLVEQVRNQLEESGRVLDGMGIDPERMKEVLAGQMGDEQRAQAEAEFRRDMEEIEQEVEQEKARLSFSSQPSGVPRPRRTMI